MGEAPGSIENRGQDALGTRGRDAHDTKQSQSPAVGRKSEINQRQSVKSVDQFEKTKPKPAVVRKL
jgi:hypothetical protein